MTGLVAAVTGGTGFVGRYCVAALAEAGWQVRLLARRDPAHPLLAGLTPELVLGDLDDAGSLGRLVAGAAVVVHAAGAIKATSAEAFLAVNVAGTARLAAAVAREAPECRFVHVSSQAARHPGLSHYAASKCDSETEMARALGACAWVILRPGVVYGPWDEASSALLRLAEGAVVPVPAGPEPRLAMVHARDAAAAVAAFCLPGPSGRVFEICDDAADGHGWREIVRAARASGVPRFLPVPDRLVLGAGMAADAWSVLAGRAFLFGRGKAREILQRDWRPDPALRPDASVWRPRIGLPEGMRETRAWKAAYSAKAPFAGGV